MRRASVGPFDQLDPVPVGIPDEADSGTALGHAVGRSLGLDSLTLQLRQRLVQVADTDRDMAVTRAQLVGAAVVVVRQLQNVLLAADRVEVVRRLELAVANNVHLAAERKPECLVEATALLGIRDTHHRVKK